MDTRTLSRREAIPSSITVVAFVALLAGVVALSVHRAGTFQYVLDDPYIHLSVAENIAQHGAWSINSSGFSSVTSSLSWPLLLSIATLAPINGVWLPFVLNIGVGIVTIVYVDRQWARYGIPTSWSLVGLLSLVIITPFVPLVMIGMEHLLHLLLTIVCAVAGTEYIQTETPGRRQLAVVMLAAAAVTATRYEGALLVGSIALLLLLRRRTTDSALVLAAGAAPTATYGIYSMTNGGFFVPNSILIKTETGGGGGLLSTITTIPTALSNTPSLFGLGLLSLALLYVHLDRDTWSPSSVLSAIFVLTTALHLQFGDTGWFYRYEAYLVGFGVFVSVFAGYRAYEASDLDITYLQLTLLVLVVSTAVIPVGIRSAQATMETPAASEDIQTQHGNMAAFIDESYADAAIAANDIGMSSYRHDGYLLDLWGLGNNDVARAKLDGEYDSMTMETLIREHDVEVILVYDDWFEPYGGIPDSMVKVGAWDTNQITAGGADVVSFYAVNESAAENLERNLCAYSDDLPARVTERGRYTSACEP